MTECIEREGAYPLAKKICDAIDSKEFQRLNFGMRILDWIDDIPAADVRPVVRGRWEWDVLDGTPGYRPVVLCCSNCHRVSFSGWDYCPNCGADMRESKQKSKQVGILEEES